MKAQNHTTYGTTMERDGTTNRTQRGTKLRTVSQYPQLVFKQTHMWMKDEKLF